MPYDYLLFDLGHVLVQLRTFSFLKRFKPGWSAVQIDHWWSNLDCIRLFETGQIEERAFLKMAAEETAFAGTIAEFRDLFASWVLGVYPGAEELINDLRKQVRIGVLSNTNPLHINIINRDTNMLELFDDRFYSYEMGLMKPDRRVYEKALSRIGVPADRIVFFDDNRTNIEAATAVGLQSILVSDFDDLAQKIGRIRLGKADVRRH